MTPIIKTISLSAALLGVVIAHAQTSVYNTGTLGISPGVDVYISGSFNNTATASLINRGNLRILQGLVNAQPGMTSGAGTLYLSGSVLQVVSGPQPFATFNLVTNNPAGVLLNTDLNVSGLHTFAAGVVTTSDAPTFLHYLNGASYTGLTDTRYIRGSVSKTGNTDFTFPLGNGTVQRPLAISNLSAVSTFTASYGGPTTNPLNITTPLVKVSPYEYWTLNRISGGTATVDLFWDNSKVTMPPYIVADIRVANYVGGSWVNRGGNATGNTATTGTIRSNPLSTFGAFTFGSISFALPVNIIQFTASAAAGGNLVSWTTSDEINVSHYELQRSDDGISFYNLGNTAAQNAAGILQYNYTDSKAVQQPTVYYRLRSVDKDSTSKLSKIISLSSNNASPALLYAINPVHNRIELQVQRITGKLHYSVNSLSGQTLQRGELNIGQSGRYSIPLLSAIAKGVYVLQVEKPGFIFTQRLVVD